MEFNPSSVDVDYAVDHLVIRQSLGRNKTAGLGSVAARRLGVLAGKGLSSARDAIAGAGEAIGPYWDKLVAAETPGWQAGRNALIGAGAGGLLGFGRSLVSDERRKDPLGDMVTGAALGGALGGGGTMAYHGARKLMPGAFGEKGMLEHAADLRQAKALLQAAKPGTPDAVAAQAKLDAAMQGVKQLGGDAQQLLNEIPDRGPTAANIEADRPVEALKSFAPENKGALIGGATGGFAGAKLTGKLDSAVRAPFAGQAMRDAIHGGTGGKIDDGAAAKALAGKPRFSFNANRAMGDTGNAIPPQVAKDLRRRVPGKTRGVRTLGGFGGMVGGAYLGHLLDGR